MTISDQRDYQMPTVDELVAGDGVGASQVDLFRAAAEVRFDGIRYGEFRPKPTTSHLDWRFDKDSSERALVAHAFAAAGIVEAVLFRREKPDFECAISGGDRFGLEVAEIHDPEHAAFDNNLVMITLGVISALDREDQRKLASGVHCAIALGLAPTSADSRRIRDELISWFDAGLPSTADGIVAFDAHRYPVLARHRPFGRCDVGQVSHLS